MTDTNSIPSPARVWIEKTIVRNRQDRLEGGNRLGEALWSPQRSSDGRDIYANMREVKPGDIVLHFIDNESIAGVSRVVQPFDDGFVGPENTDWTGQPAYRIQLRDYQQLDPPVCTENPIRVDNVTETPKLAE